MKTEAYRLYSRVFWIFLPNFIKIARCNFELYRFKVKTFFWDTVYFILYRTCLMLVTAVCCTTAFMDTSKCRNSCLGDWFSSTSKINWLIDVDVIKTIVFIVCCLSIVTVGHLSCALVLWVCESSRWLRFRHGVITAAPHLPQKFPLPLRRSLPLSDAPIPRPTPLTTPKVSRSS